MSSTPKCAMHEGATPDLKKVRIYTIGTQRFALCRQCAVKLGVQLVVDAVKDGSDVESVFRDIMLTLAQSKDRAKDTDKDTE